MLVRVPVGSTKILFGFKDKSQGASWNGAILASTSLHILPYTTSTSDGVSTLHFCCFIHIVRNLLVHKLHTSPADIFCNTFHWTCNTLASPCIFCHGTTHWVECILHCILRPASASPKLLKIDNFPWKFDFCGGEIWDRLTTLALNSVPK